jgi:hypothetical protein
MKIIDISSFDVVKTGIEFHVVTSSKESTAVAELLPNMERNEGAVFWLQPKNGTVEQQEACICVNGVYYALNSKFEKAIFRNVRLTRDFKNLERLVDGTRKLVIPRRLFYKKLRTSRRVSKLACMLIILPVMLLVMLLVMLRNNVLQSNVTYFRRT